MKTKFPFIVCLTIISIVFACREVNNKRIQVNEFPESKKLYGRVISEIKPQYIRTIRLIDSILVIINREGDFFFEYYNSDDFELIGKYGIKGKGPGEFLYPKVTGDFVKKTNTETIMQVYDWHKRSVIFIDLYKSIYNNSYNYKSFVFNDDLKNASGVIFINDSIIGMIPDHRVHSRFVMYNRNNDSIMHIPFIPRLAMWKINRGNRYYLYATDGHCVYQDKFFIAAPSGNGQIDFFTLTGNYLRTIHLRDNNYLKESRNPESVMNIDGFNIFYSDLQIVDGKVFALFSIVKLPDLKKITKSRIYVFDLEGNPKKEYILDKEIHRFAIDTVNKRFIGLLTNEGELASFSYE
jgi:hypothetical protein